jgi:tetratricopeptide (TPR) repeat protein
VTSQTAANASPIPDGSRLARLQSFLLQDPHNDSIRSDIFDLALATGNLAAAEEQIDHAAQANVAAPAWEMREANLRIAQRRYDDAEKLLGDLREAAGEHPAISQNLGFIASLSGDYQRCYEEIRPWNDVEAAAPIEPAMQNIWLRCLHHLGKLDVAMQWTEQRQQHSAISPEALGIASLIAIDANNLAKAKEWATQSIQAGAKTVEALLTLSMLALADRDGAESKQYALQVIEYSRNNGRAWSSLGFAQLLMLDIRDARHSLEEAIKLMPSHIGTRHGFGWACLLEKDYVSAQQAFEAALELDRNFGETHGGLAVIAALAGQREAAQEHVRRAQLLDRDGLSVQYAQALLDGRVSDEESIRRFSRELLRGIRRR